jgi:hypothetical protein
VQLGIRLLIGMIGVPALGVLALLGAWTPAYIPSGLMAEAAAGTRDPAAARERMAWLLRRCRKGGRFRAEEIGVRYHSIRSWQNDAGWLARTDVRCADGGSCTVAAHALIAAPRQSLPCRRYPPRQLGFSPGA